MGFQEMILLIKERFKLTLSGIIINNQGQCSYKTLIQFENTNGLVMEPEIGSD